jgi:hypothetical protein
MPHCQGKRAIAVVSACMTADGTPAFALNQIAVTQDEAENGIHYYLAEAELLQKGFEEPFVHFDQFEAPSFLLPAVREYLESSNASPQTTPVFPF